MQTLIIILVFLLSACQQRGKELSPSSPSDNPVFTGHILQGEDANDYRVALEWNNDVKPVTWYLKRGEKEHELQQIAMLDGDQFDFVDEEAIPGKAYHYLLGYTENGDFIIRGRFIIEVPRDVVADRVISKKNFRNVNRVFFKGHSLSDSGSGLTIRANEVIAKDAVLRHVSYSRSEPGEPLTIIAKRAHGHLKIVAYGRSGNSGFRKADWLPEEIKPGDGSHTPRVHVEVLHDEGFSVDVERRRGSGGEWHGEPQTPGGKDGELRPFCIRQAGQMFGDCASFPILLKKEEVNHE